MTRHSHRGGSGRDPQTFARDPMPVIGECPTCGKVVYLSRKTARLAARRLPQGNRSRAYRCLANPEHWHIGHVPDAVRHGVITRDDWRVAKGWAS